jgi:hypothetical protein
VIRPPKLQRRSPEAAVHGRTVQMKHGFVERRAASVFEARSYLLSASRSSPAPACGRGLGVSAIWFALSY